MFLTPRRIRRPAREQVWLASASRHDYVMPEGHRLATWVWGESLRGTVLLVHGWEGRASQMGAMAIAIAEQGYRVVAIDLPAHGDSVGRMTNIVECGKVIDAVASRLGPFDAIVAHSFGCAATTAAVARGVRTDGLVFISPASDYIHFGRFFSSTLGLRPETAERIRETIERRLGVAWSDLQPDSIAHRTDIPLLVIHDEHDREIPVEQGEKVARAWTGGTFVSTRRLGHRRIVRDEGVIGHVLAYLEAPRDLALAV
jgi:pimeloyl-ACP methyl ester carboxylesterase